MFRATWMISLLIAVTGPLSAQEKTYQPPDSFLRDGRLEEYVTQAKHFLERKSAANGESARIATDILMVATIQENQTLANEMKARLVFEHPNSIAANYVLFQFKPDTFRSFLLTHFKSSDRSLDDAYLRKFVQVVRRGMKKFGPALLATDEFLLQVALANSLDGDFNLDFALPDLLRQSKQETQQIAAITTSKSSGADKKFVALHQFKDNATARLFQRYFHSKMTEQEKSSPDVQIVMVENSLIEKQFVFALGILQEWNSAAHNEKTLYWRAWCEASTGQADVAVETIEKLLQRFPKSRYRLAAQRLKRSFQSQDEILNQHAVAVQRGSNDYSPGRFTGAHFPKRLQLKTENRCCAGSSRNSIHTTYQSPKPG